MQQEHTQVQQVVLHAPLSSPPSSYHSLRARPFPCEEIPEVGRLALLLRRLSHPDAAALHGAAQAGAAPCAATAAQTQAQSRAQCDPAVLGVRILTVESRGGGGGVDQAEQVVVGVKLTHVVDGFPGMHLACKRNRTGVKPVSSYGLFVQMMHVFKGLA